MKYRKYFHEENGDWDSDLLDDKNDNDDDHLRDENEEDDVNDD